ncbi:polysaccharide deacetylase family protein [Halosegnis marinus]|uniref:polysaccharide deacetylase family protein n=1 Tax=Halosegnis marinus TaxID=3034023 RepID=UPI003618FD13
MPGRNPYWQFDRVMALERDLGVRSAFYFMDEQRLFRDRPPREWLTVEGWKLYAGRYSVDDPRVADAVRRLAEGGWEVGLHGSYESYRDGDRLAREKAAVEAVLGDEVRGGRQHYLNLDAPATWRRQADAGLRYDSSLGSSTTYGFEHGYEPLRPFDDEFVVFPLTAMEAALPDIAERPAAAWAACDALLREACDEGAVMTVLWHPRTFSEADFPNHADLYRRLIERARELGAWVGPPGEYYAAMDHPDRTEGKTVPAADRAPYEG